MTLLAERLRELIALEGPISVERFMTLALGDPRHGYYMTRDPFGAGDFVTSPEISQVFGELLGLWSADLWERMGRPDPVRLVELGPGRGALMQDFLRAARIAPEFLSAIRAHLVETSPVLIKIQRETLAAATVPLTWSARFEDVAPGPAMVIANEFFDALPVRQYVRSGQHWRERLVGLDAEDRLAFGMAPEPERMITIDAPAGSVIEIGVEARTLMRAVANRLARQGGCGLVIDYGAMNGAATDTLQAMRRGACVGALEFPGDSDLTAHVDFAALANAALDSGAKVFGPVRQAAFLRELGLGQRVARLTSRAEPTRRAAIEAGACRLVDEAEATGMGALFKVMAIGGRDCPRPAGFGNSK